jgi:acetoin utilization deacetylase AcuC-like enzyme
MLVLADDAHLDHDPSSHPAYPEVPRRVASIREALSAAGLVPEEFHSESADALRGVHPPEMLAYFREACAAISAGDTRYPKIHRSSTSVDSPRTGRPPGLRRGFCFDQTPLTSGTPTAALAAANLALEGAARLTDSTDRVYCLCRPPGHHAGSDFFGGFCYLNNAALAADRLSEDGKVAILDIDYHHGNGTQEIFYTRGDVLYVSIHAHPAYAYPGFSGHADEIGAGLGDGSNFNHPLGPSSGDAELLAGLPKALEEISKFDPSFLVVSLGTDIAAGDPIADWLVSEEGFNLAAEQISRLGPPILVIQEGGYSLARIGADVTAFLRGLG